MIKSTQRIKTTTSKIQTAKSNKKTTQKQLKGTLKKDLVNTPVKRKTKRTRRTNKAKDHNKSKSMRSTIKKHSHRSQVKSIEKLRNGKDDLNNNRDVIKVHRNSLLVQHFRELLRQKELNFQNVLAKDTSQESSSEEEKVVARNYVEIPKLKLKYVENSIDSDDRSQWNLPESPNDLQESVTDLSEILGSSNISSRSLSYRNVKM